MLATGCFNQRFVQPSVQNTKLALQFGNLLLDRFPVAAKHKAMAMEHIRCLGYYLDDLWWALKSLDASWCILLGGFHRFHPRKHDKLYIPDAQNRLSFHSHRSHVENPCWSDPIILKRPLLKKAWLWISSSWVYANFPSCIFPHGVSFYIPFHTRIGQHNAVYCNFLPPVFILLLFEHGLGHVEQYTVAQLQ